MPYIVCAEENEGRWIAHVPDLPGCFSSHQDREAAIATIPQAVEAYLAWCADHGLHISGLSGPMIVSEVIRAWDYEDDYEVNAFFASDRPPLLPEEAPEFERLLQAAREDLQAAISGLTAENLAYPFPEERRPIRGILDHVAQAEIWYLDRLGLAPASEELNPDTLVRLEQVRKHTIASLPALIERTGTVTLSGETWSARKVLRRTLWHERDHTQHILKLRDRLA